MGIGDSKAADGPAMIDKQKLRAQLKKHEGVRQFVYDDVSGMPIDEACFVRGKPTIGVGRNLADRGLDETEIDFLLDNDINDCIAEAQKFRWFEALNPVRQAAVVELVFNLGLTRLSGFKKFLNFMNEHRYTHAAGELKNSLWYRQVKGRGDTLANQIITGEWQT
jgi:lysozyme